MKIEVHLHATLRVQNFERTGNPRSIEIPAGSSIKDLLEDLSIGLDFDHLLLVCNGRTADLDQILNDGDVLNLMTAVSGG